MMNEPLQIGTVYVEEAKGHLSKLHYSCMEDMYGGWCKLLYTDIDSLAYLMKAEEKISEVLYENRKYFDL